MDVNYQRLISISKCNPLLPEKFVPWHQSIDEHEIYLPEALNSLHGLPLYDRLSKEQKLELGRHEVVQVMYSYAWSEGLFCLFMNRFLLTLQPKDLRYQFLLRELIEEFRHQEMFATAIEHLNGVPVLPNFWHRFFGQLTVRFLPADIVFMSGLSVELIADLYGTKMRQTPNVYLVLKKVAELHNIEEARHILFTKDLLSRYTHKAGFLRRTIYSHVVLWNVYFMRTLYVKREIFERIGIADSRRVFQLAYANYRKKFGQQCLTAAVDFVEEWNGFNWLTRWAWRLFLKADLK